MLITNPPLEIYSDLDYSLREIKKTMIFPMIPLSSASSPLLLTKKTDLRQPIEPKQYKEKEEKRSSLPSFFAQKLLNQLFRRNLINREGLLNRTSLPPLFPLHLYSQTMGEVHQRLDHQFYIRPMGELSHASSFTITPRSFFYNFLEITKAMHLAVCEIEIFGGAVPIGNDYMEGMAQIFCGRDLSLLNSFREKISKRQRHWNDLDVRIIIDASPEAFQEIASKITLEALSYSSRNLYSPKELRECCLKNYWKGRSNALLITIGKETTFDITIQNRNCSDAYIFSGGKAAVSLFPFLVDYPTPEIVPTYRNGSLWQWFIDTTLGHLRLEEERSRINRGALPKYLIRTTKGDFSLKRGLIKTLFRPISREEYDIKSTFELIERSGKKHLSNNPLTQLAFSCNSLQLLYDNFGRESFFKFFGYSAWQKKSRKKKSSSSSSLTLCKSLELCKRGSPEFIPDLLKSFSPLFLFLINQELALSYHISFSYREGNLSLMLQLDRRENSSFIQIAIDSPTLFYNWENPHRLTPSRKALDTMFSLFYQSDLNQKKIVENFSALNISSSELFEIGERLSHIKHPLSIHLSLILLLSNQPSHLPSHTFLRELFTRLFYLLTKEDHRSSLLPHLFRKIQHELRENSSLLSTLERIEKSCLTTTGRKPTIGPLLRYFIEALVTSNEDSLLNVANLLFNEFRKRKGVSKGEETTIFLSLLSQYARRNASHARERLTIEYNRALFIDHKDKLIDWLIIQRVSDAAYFPLIEDLLKSKNQLPEPFYPLAKIQFERLVKSKELEKALAFLKLIEKKTASKRLSEKAFFAHLSIAHAYSSLLPPNLQKAETIALTVLARTRRATHRLRPEDMQLLKKVYHYKNASASSLNSFFKHLLKLCDTKQIAEWRALILLEKIKLFSLLLQQENWIQAKQLLKGERQIFTHSNAIGNKSFQESFTLYYLHMIEQVEDSPTAPPSAIFEELWELATTFPSFLSKDKIFRDLHEKSLFLAEKFLRFSHAKGLDTLFRKNWFSISLAFVTSSGASWLKYQTADNLYTTAQEEQWIKQISAEDLFRLHTTYLHLIHCHLSSYPSAALTTAKKHLALMKNLSGENREYIDLYHKIRNAEVYKSPPMTVGQVISAIEIEKYPTEKECVERWILAAQRATREKKFYISLTILDQVSQNFSQPYDEQLFSHPILSLINQMKHPCRNLKHSTKLLSLFHKFRNHFTLEKDPATWHKLINNLLRWKEFSFVAYLLQNKVPIALYEDADIYTSIWNHMLDLVVKDILPKKQQALFFKDFIYPKRICYLTGIIREPFYLAYEKNRKLDAEKRWKGLSQLTKLAQLSCQRETPSPQHFNFVRALHNLLNQFQDIDLPSGEFYHLYIESELHLMETMRYLIPHNMYDCCIYLEERLSTVRKRIKKKAPKDRLAKRFVELNNSYYSRDMPFLRRSYLRIRNALFIGLLFTLINYYLFIEDESV